MEAILMRIGFGSTQEGSDADLVLRARSGDARAYEALVRRYERLVYRVLWSRGAEADSIDDLAQETFLRAWQRLHTFDTAQPFKAWIARVAENLAIDHHRALVRKPAPVGLPEEGSPSEPATGPLEDPATLTVGRDDQRRLLQVLQGLPEHYREALVLRFLEDLSYDEIAAQLGLPLGSVKTRIFRGRDLLKQRLAGAQTGGTTA